MDKTDRELLEQIAQDVQEIKAQNARREVWLNKFWQAVKSAAGQLFGAMKSEEEKQKP